jgi:hypothetical protein
LSGRSNAKTIWPMPVMRRKDKTRDQGCAITCNHASLTKRVFEIAPLGTRPQSIETFKKIQRCSGLDADHWVPKSVRYTLRLGNLIPIAASGSLDHYKASVVLINMRMY